MINYTPFIVHFHPFPSRLTCLIMPKAVQNPSKSLPAAKPSKSTTGGGVPPASSSSSAAAGTSSSSSSAKATAKKTKAHAKHHHQQQPSVSKNAAAAAPSARVLRLNADPMMGFSERRIRAYALQAGLVKIDQLAIAQIRAVLSAHANRILDLAHTLREGALPLKPRSRMLTGEHVLLAYERASGGRTLFGAEEVDPCGKSDQKSALRAIDAAGKRRKHAAAVAPPVAADAAAAQ